MDQRLAVEHDKRYTAGEVLRTDLLRARGLTQTWIRNRLTPEKRAHYASVPWFFGAGVLCMGLATVSLILALVSGSANWLLGAAGSDAWWHWS